MNYSFYIVGKKDNDCYALYDAREGMGGKAFASKYTLKQLKDMGQTIAGYDNANNGKVIINIVNLKGELTKRSVSLDDIPDVKRSASTFIKGIKVSKEEKRKNKEIGEKRSATIQKKKEENPEDPILSFYKIVIKNKGVLRLTPSMASIIYNYGVSEEDKIYDFEQLYSIKGSPMPVYYSKSKDVVRSFKLLKKRYDEIVYSLHLKDGKFVNYSFFSQKDHTPRVIAEYLVKTTKKPFKYTHGLKMRHPAIYEQPRSRQEILGAWERNGMTDIYECEDYIDVQQFSGNDMW